MERYGTCQKCRGYGCLRCDGMGFDGSAMAYCDRENAKDWAYTSPPIGYRTLVHPWIGSSLPDFFPNASQAMEQAVKAIQSAQQKEKEKMKFKSSDSKSHHFVKLGDKESIVGVFQGDPYDFRKHWDQKEKKSSICTGADTCEKCKSGEKSSFRFRLNFVVKKHYGYIAKIFEQGWNVYEMLRTLHESDYNLEKHFVRITRHGTGTQTNYAILPVQGGVLSENQIKTVAAIKLHDLVNLDNIEATNLQETKEEEFDIPF